MRDLKNIRRDFYEKLLLSLELSKDWVSIEPDIAQKAKSMADQIDTVSQPPDVSMTLPSTLHNYVLQQLPSYREQEPEEFILLYKTHASYLISTLTLALNTEISTRRVINIFNTLNLFLRLHNYMTSCQQAGSARQAVILAEYSTKLTQIIEKITSYLDNKKDTLNAGFSLAHLKTKELNFIVNIVQKEHKQPLVAQELKKLTRLIDSTDARSTNSSSTSTPLPLQKVEKRKPSHVLVSAEKPLEKKSKTSSIQHHPALSFGLYPGIFSILKGAADTNSHPVGLWITATPPEEKSNSEKTATLQLKILKP